MKQAVHRFGVAASIVVLGACNTSSAGDDVGVLPSVGTGGQPSGIPISTGTGGDPTSMSSTGGTSGIPIATAGMEGSTAARGGAGGSDRTSQPSPHAGSSSGGAAGAGGAADPAADEGPHDHDLLLACATPACSASYAQLIDDHSLQANQGPCTCLLEALRDRTPGVYQHNVASNSARGEQSTEHVFLIRSDGTVTRTTKLTQNGRSFAANGTSGMSYTDAEHCRLADPTYFDGCLASLQNEELTPEALAWVCLYGDVESAWLGGCNSASASCN